MKLPYAWLTELVKVPAGVEDVASALALRGFEVASIDNGVIDFEITANRPDCLSVIGLAREASAAFALPLAVPGRNAPSAGDASAHPIDVTIEDAELCPRYCAQMFELGSGAASPGWLRERLEACGVRSISPVVDVTNYVMLEMGQPTHAFDYAKLAGHRLRIRRAKPGERIRTLDGVDRTLDPDMLVIADADRAQAIGGVMGGAESEISGATRLMVLESAYFKPASVRRTSRRLALKTEASTRFERGADVEAAPVAIARAAALLEEIGAARPIGPMVDRYPSPRKPLTLTLRASRIQHVLGIAVADADVPTRLKPLGFSVSDDRGPMTVDHRWTVTVPTFRVDVEREIDLIEEIARHDGYKGLPATFPELTAAQAPPDPRPRRDQLIRQLLTACGMSEAVTFSFIEAAAAQPFVTSDAVAVQNPLSEKFAVMRPSLLPGLVDAAAHNRRRQHEHVRLFETGTQFRPQGETRAVAGVWCGAGIVPHWSSASRAADFYDVKGVVDTICRAFGVEPAFEPADVPYLVRGRSASIVQLGVVGQIVPAIAEARGFPPDEALWAFELNADALGQARGDDLRAESLPRFPSIVRDLSVLIDTALPAASLRGTIRTAAPETLTHVVEFDRYRGKGVPEGRVSLSLRLTFRSPERTLTDAEVDAAMERIVKALADSHGAVRR
ncbi:MAG TPA: phenylalanine--tRNA ligase subunit beta [Vicinamibacterales bacterium]|nr:phenylalanine--tRNA ligase subunit beta [Vicinamibacterales bacterium]